MTSIPVTYQRRLCEFCLTKSDIELPEYFESAGWTEVHVEDGSELPVRPLDRCPGCGPFLSREVEAAAKALADEFDLDAFDGDGVTWHRIAAVALTAASSLSREYPVTNDRRAGS